MKPSFWRSPLAWTLRQVRLKTGDLVSLLGYKASKRVDFSTMRGEEFAHVIDVGVADGTPDLYARFPKAYLDLFEPHPAYQRHLEETVMGQRPSRLHKLGLGSKDSTATLYLKGRTGSSFENDKGEGSLEVPVRRLDSVLTPDMIKRPCLLKIDTEGYEMEVLRGATGILPFVDCIVSEVHFCTPQMYRPREIINHLGDLGFELTDMLDHHAGDGQVWCADFVFRRIPAEAQPSLPVATAEPAATAGLNSSAAIA